MKLVELLQTTRQIFLDTAPIVYYIEENQHYLARVDMVFGRLDNGDLSAVASPITLAECLVVPFRKEQATLKQVFTDLILQSDNIVFYPIDHLIALQAAQIRAQYNLTLPDAFQAAIALASGCESLLTNDPVFKRIPGLNVIVLDEVDLK